MLSGCLEIIDDTYPSISARMMCIVDPHYLKELDEIKEEMENGEYIAKIKTNMEGLIMMDEVLEIIHDYKEAGLIQEFNETEREIKKLIWRNESLNKKSEDTVPELFEDYYMFVPVVVMELRDIIEDNQKDIQESCSELYTMLQKKKFFDIDEQLGIIEELLNDYDEELIAIKDYVKDIQFLEDKLKEAEKSIDSYVFVKKWSDDFTEGIFNSGNLIRLLTAIKATNRRNNLHGAINYVGGNLYIEQDNNPIARTNEVSFNKEFIVFIRYANAYINEEMSCGHLSELVLGE